MNNIIAAAAVEEIGPSERYDEDRCDSSAKDIRMRER
jgi:hypothetical protein